MMMHGLTKSKFADSVCTSHKTHDKNLYICLGKTPSFVLRTMIKKKYNTLCGQTAKPYLGSWAVSDMRSNQILSP
jgi:hypothetical protein